jgi:hypothetical protein
MQNDQNARHSTGQDCFYSSLDCSINKQKSHKSSLYHSYTIVMCIISREITSHDITLLPAWARANPGSVGWDRQGTEGANFLVLGSEIAPQQKKVSVTGEDNFHLCLIIEHPTSNNLPGSSDTPNSRHNHRRLNLIHQRLLFWLCCEEQTIKDRPEYAHDLSTRDQLLFSAAPHTTMKVFSNSCNFDYSWEEVSTANWRKYCPWNDKSTHVIAVDTLSRHVDSDTGIVSFGIRQYWEVEYGC